MYSYQLIGFLGSRRLIFDVFWLLLFFSWAVVLIDRDMYTHTIHPPCPPKPNTNLYRSSEVQPRSPTRSTSTLTHQGMYINTTTLHNLKLKLEFQSRRHASYIWPFFGFCQHCIYLSRRNSSFTRPSLNRQRQLQPFQPRQYCHIIAILCCNYSAAVLQYPL